MFMIQKYVLSMNLSSCCTASACNVGQVADPCCSCHWPPSEDQSVRKVEMPRPGGSKDTHMYRRGRQAEGKPTITTAEEPRRGGHGKGQQQGGHDRASAAQVPPSTDRTRNKSGLLNVPRKVCKTSRGFHRCGSHAGEVMGLVQRTYL